MESTERAGLSAAQRWLLTLSCLAVVLVIASMAALYTALPEIAAATGASQAELTWIVDGYTLALACLVLP
ncbi:MFS transporter, partial [Nocardia aurea]